MLGDENMKGYLKTNRPLKELATLSFDMNEYGLEFHGGVFYGTGAKWGWKKNDEIHYIIFISGCTPVLYHKLDEPEKIINPDAQSIAATFKIYLSIDHP